MTRLFLHFGNVSATFRIWRKEHVSQICVVPVCNFDNWITFGPLRIRCLFYIWTTLLITVHTSTVVIISLNLRKYTILLCLVWLNSKKLSFTLFLLCYHKGWTTTLVCCLLSTAPIYSTANYTSATYNYDATTTFFWTAQQWTTSDATTINISSSAICTQPPVQLTGLLGVWMSMWHGDLKITYWRIKIVKQEFIYPNKQGTLTEPHYMFCGNPVEEHRAKWWSKYWFTYSSSSKFFICSIKKCACTNETAACNLCNERLGVRC